MYTDTIQQAITRGEKVALVIGLSAGKDSTAVALLAKDKLWGSEPTSRSELGMCLAVNMQQK